jgi:hypothetical protein
MGWKGKGKRSIFSVSLWAPERAMLDYMCSQEDRIIGDMVRIAIREAAKARGLKPEMFEPQPERVA